MDFGADDVSVQFTPLLQRYRLEWGKGSGWEGGEGWGHRGFMETLYSA